MISAELNRAEVGGHSVAYRAAGEGPALVLLHGFLGDSRVWERQLMDLSDQFTVVAWDAPGAGSSSGPPDPFAMTDWAQCLAEFLDVIGIARAHVLGLSWGRRTRAGVLSPYPSRVLSLILADTYAGWKGSPPETVCEARLARCLLEASMPAEEFVTRWVPELFSEAASQDLQEEMSTVVSDFHPLGFRLMARSLADTDTRSLLPNIHAPTLLVWGDRDQRSPMNVAEQFCDDAIPNTQLAVIANAGHVSNMEQPRQFNAHVRGFCLSVRRTASPTM